MLAGHGRTVMSRPYCDVTYHLQDVASAHCIACYHGDDWLGHPPYLHLNATSDTSACLGMPSPEQKIGLVLLLPSYQSCDYVHISTLQADSSTCMKAKISTLDQDRLASWLMCSVWNPDLFGECASTVLKFTWQANLLGIANFDMNNVKIMQMLTLRWVSR